MVYPCLQAKSGYWPERERDITCYSNRFNYRYFFTGSHILPLVLSHSLLFIQATLTKEH